MNTQLPTIPTKEKVKQFLKKILLAAAAGAILLAALNAVSAESKRETVFKELSLFQREEDFAAKVHKEKTVQRCKKQREALLLTLTENEDGTRVIKQEEVEQIQNKLTQLDCIQNFTTPA